MSYQIGTILPYNKTKNLELVREIQITNTKKNARHYRRQPSELVFALSWAYEYNKNYSAPMIVRPTNSYDVFLYGIKKIEDAWRFPVYYNDTLAFVIENEKIYEAKIVEK